MYPNLDFGKVSRLLFRPISTRLPLPTAFAPPSTKVTNVVTLTSVNNLQASLATAQRRVEQGQNQVQRDSEQLAQSRQDPRATKTGADTRSAAQQHRPDHRPPDRCDRIVYSLNSCCNTGNHHFSPRCGCFRFRAAPISGVVMSTPCFSARPAMRSNGSCQTCRPRSKVPLCTGSNHFPCKSRCACKVSSGCMWMSGHCLS